MTAVMSGTCPHCGEGHAGWCPEQAAVELATRGVPPAPAPAPLGRYATIPTRDRPAELSRCVAAITGQVDALIIVDNRSVPPVQPPGDRAVVVYCPDDPPNLSRLWNVGLDLTAKLAGDAGHTAWDVAVLNDDAVPPPGWLDACAAAMRAHGAAAASSGPHLARPLIHRQPGPVNVRDRLCGWAFVLAGERGLRADERFRWWWNDDDLFWQANQAGGTVIVPGFPVPNTRANSTTVGVLAQYAAEDKAKFVAKWGTAPW